MVYDEDNSHKSLFAVAVLIVLLAAAMLRVAAARGELWLDEVWTIRLVQENVQTPSDILLKLKHDNNHFLNSLVAYFVGPDGTAWMYRWPAVLAGSLTVFLAGWMQRRNRAAMLAALLLTGCSYLLVHYSSEARGYAYLMFFAMLALALLAEMETAWKWSWECLFSLACILGFLAHPLFLIVYLATQVWTWLPMVRGKIEQPVAKLIVRTILPGAFFGWLYFAVLRQVQIGGGDVRPYFQIIVQTLSLAVGGPFNAPGSYVAAAVTVLLALAALWNVARQSFQQFSFYLCAIIIFPALILIIAPRDDVYPRYFLISVLFLMMLWSDFLGDICRQFIYGKWVASFVLAAFVAANGWHISQLIALGRGHYAEALETMTQESPSQVVLVMDHPFRQGMMLDYFIRRAGLTKPIQALQTTPDAVKQTDWLLVHNLDVDFDPPQTIAPEGTKFRLIKHYPFPGLSGWHLCLYRREP